MEGLISSVPERFGMASVSSALVAFRKFQELGFIEFSNSMTSSIKEAC